MACFPFGDEKWNKFKQLPNWRHVSQERWSTAYYYNALTCNMKRTGSVHNLKERKKLSATFVFFPSRESSVEDVIEKGFATQSCSLWTAFNRCATWGLWCWKNSLLSKENELMGNVGEWCWVPANISIARCVSTSSRNLQSHPEIEARRKFFLLQKLFLCFSFFAPPNTREMLRVLEKLSFTIELNVACWKYFLRLIIFLMLCYVRNMFTLWHIRL